jgi:GntR family transcriptional regulator
VSYDSVWRLMRWLVDYHSGVPVYLQLVQQAKAAVATGTLRAGDQLPSVRAMAEELKLNRNTVARAWAELESEGVLENRQGSGCFVTSTVTPLRRAVRNERLAQAFDQVIVQAHHLQVDDEALRALLDDRLRHFRTTRKTEGERE